MRTQVLNSALRTQHLIMGGRSSVVEFQPSKLAVVGSNPIARSKGRREAVGVKREKSRKYSGSVVRTVVSAFTIHVSRRGTPT